MGKAVLAFEVSRFSVDFSTVFEGVYSSDICKLSAYFFGLFNNKR